MSETKIWNVQHWDYGKLGDAERLEKLLCMLRQTQNFVVVVRPETDTFIIVGASGESQSEREAAVIADALNMAGV